MNNIRITRDNYFSDVQALNSNYIVSKYKLGFDDFVIDTKNKEELIDLLMNMNNFNKEEFKFSEFSILTILENEDFLITFSSADNNNKNDISLFFNNYKDIKDIFTTIQEYRHTKYDGNIDISNFYLRGSDIDYNIKTKDLGVYETISVDYFPFLDVNEMFKQYLISDSNILLLSGETGLGKTKLGEYFLYHLLKNINAFKSKTTANVNVAYIKNESILSMDVFWNILYDGEYDVVFLDDLDYSLLPRKQNITSGEDIEKNKFISNLLSFTDGIYNSGSNTKFIITTNRPVSDIDSAILRKGRTFDILKLRALTRAEALRIWEFNGFTKEDFENTFVGKQIQQAELGETIKILIKANKKGETFSKYIKEDGISVYADFKNGARIGF